MKFAPPLLATFVAASLALAIWSEQPRGRVFGQLSAPVEPPPVGTRVFLVPLDGQDGGAWQRTKTNADGSFTLRHIRTGRYRIMAESGKQRAETTVTVGEVGMARAALTLKAPKPGATPAPRIHPKPDAAVVRRRALDIIQARFLLDRELLDTIRRNDVSGLPLPVVLAQAGAESSFQPHLRGKLDEFGLFQLMEGTAQDLEAGPFTGSTLMNPATNTRLATLHLGRLSRAFKNTRTALIAYNQGERKTRRDGMYPVAQVYADAIMMAAYHEQFRARVLQLDPSLKTAWEK